VMLCAEYGGEFILIPYMVETRLCCYYTVIVKKSKERV
jgi:hypothetical protein